MNLSKESKLLIKFIQQNKIDKINLNNYSLIFFNDIYNFFKEYRYNKLSREQINNYKVKIFANKFMSDEIIEYLNGYCLKKIIYFIKEGNLNIYLNFIMFNKEYSLKKTRSIC